MQTADGIALIGSHPWIPPNYSTFSHKNFQCHPPSLLPSRKQTAAKLNRKSISLTGSKQVNLFFIGRVHISRLSIHTAGRVYSHSVNLYITSASGTCKVSFPIISDFLIIPESSFATVHRLSLDYCHCVMICNFYYYFYFILFPFSFT